MIAFKEATTHCKLKSISINCSPFSHSSKKRKIMKYVHDIVTDVCRLIQHRISQGMCSIFIRLTGLKVSINTRVYDVQIVFNFCCIMMAYKLRLMNSWIKLWTSSSKLGQLYSFLRNVSSISDWFFGRFFHAPIFICNPVFMNLFDNLLL